MNQYKLSDLLMGIPHEVLQGAIDSYVSDVVMDFNKVSIGAFLVSRRGLNVDGHRYIMEADRKGAAAYLVEDKTAAFPPGKPIIYVENTRKAMGPIAANLYGHSSRNMRLVGVTGTNGKTTTTHFIENILRASGRKTGLIGTAGIQINGEIFDFPFTTDTTPDPLELHRIFAKMHQMGVQDVIMEVSSHALALHKMEGLTFDIGVFTNLTQDHLDFHGTMQNYHDAKAQLFKISRTAVANADDPATPTMLKLFTGDPCLYYSLQADADLRALHIQNTAQGMTFDLEAGGLMQYFTLPALGRYNVYNCLAAIGVAQLLGVHAAAIREGVAQIAQVPGRLQAIPNQRGVQVFVDYAHSPDGLKSTIQAVRELTNRRVITLFGCGGDRDKEKRPQMGRIAGELSDYVLLTSDNPRTEDPAEIIRHIEAGVKETPVLYEINENRREAICAGVKLLKEGDALIIAGKGHENYQIIGTTKHHFDDYEVGCEALCD
ncbi:MAG: UDP-N-acetylmuramoyl-L-alanyl-D-glutamate--2,6-diaminopimelate ligase [Defluviitaleaceae bacterium]|nr:UDP-N-acetylmuramoyl-L-alanyl-D-glutamate--2,6-diaminopimelate ligase [Defluviitaleaceae bacterium]MCL2239968.1 UDP-N-acetylmuramoyl-L-alanyl-D-glutamate--2,6-diaminopimelate ligase [Defluviitaleaceae bacterium]